MPNDMKFLEALRVVNAELTTNQVIAQRIDNTYGLGRMYDGDRDIYESLGYPKTLEYKTLNPKYRRMGYGRRVVELYPEESWSKLPTVYDSGDPKKETEFEKSFNALAKRLRLFHWLVQLDIRSGIDKFAVLYLGAPGDDLSQPLERGDINFLQIYDNSVANVKVFDTDSNSPRYGLPTLYEIKFDESSINKKVHYSRVIHVFDNPSGSRIYGNSRLEPVFNNLMALEMIGGADGEGFWRSNIPKYSVNADADSQIRTDADDVAAQLKKLIHNYQQYIITKGMTIDTLAPTVIDPGPHSERHIAEICTTLKCPRRIFEGSERGELASSQDAKSWAARMQKRAVEHNEYNILRPFVDRAVEIGAVAEPSGGEYFVDWPPLVEASPKETAEVAKITSEAIATYVNAMGADSLIPFDIYLSEVLNFDQDKIERILEARNKMVDIDDEGRDDGLSNDDETG